MLATLALVDERTRLRVRTRDFTETRVFNSTHADQLRDLAKRYDHAVATRRDVDLLDIGSELSLWLDGSSGWLERILECEPPLLLEVRVPRRFDETDRALLDAPWELLANGHGFLVADRHIRLSPLRRISGGEPQPLGPQPGALTVLFMAASPRGVSELEFEAEEALILAATKGLPLDLFVEETGSARELGMRATQLATPEHAVHVVQVSCHGENSPEPAMLLEDERGGLALATAEDLYRSLGEMGSRIGLLFLSACSTAAASPARPTDSLTLDLVRSGMPAVLGWAAPVGDWAANHFATVLYERLARGDTSLEVAVGEARRELLVADSGPSPYWHLSRLLLGSTGGGRLSLPSGHRRKQGAIHKHFLGGDRRILVAGPDEFVGRRRTLQACVRALRDDQSVGLLLHGTSGMGKSSIAARVVDRMSSHEAVVLHGQFDHEDVIDKVAAAIGSAAKLWRDEWWLKERETGDALRALLEARLGKPLLLVLDDFEQLLDGRRDDLHVVKAGVVDLVRGIVHAFVHAGSPSRLLVTSRFEFVLVDRVGEDLAGKLVRISVPSFSDREEAKRLRRAWGEPELLLRCVGASYGNPALLSLLLLRAEQDPVGCEALLDQVEGLTEIADEELRTSIEYLAVESVIEALNPSERELLRLSLLFEVPVPLELVPALCEAVNPPVRDKATRLVALGAWDVFPDVVDDRGAVMPNRMVAEWSLRVGLSSRRHRSSRRRRSLPSEAQRDALARRLLPGLRVVWSGISRHVGDESCGRAGHWLGSMALRIGNNEALAEFAWLAVTWRARVSSTEEARKFSRSVVERLNTTGKLDDAMLLLDVARLHETGGDGAFWMWCLEQALARVGTLSKGNQAAVHFHLASVRVRQVDLDDALEHLKRAAALTEETGDLRSRAVIAGKVAHILHGRGHSDEALHIHTKEELPVYEQLGDLRSRAICLGKVADILEDRGDLDEALRILCQEVLPAVEWLGDVRTRALTFGKVTDILEARGEFDEALRILRQELLPVFEGLGDARSRALTLGRVADILHARGDLDEAFRIHTQEEIPVYERLGDVRERAAALGRVADILEARGEFDEALRIRTQEVLPVFERLGDVRSRALTLGRVADTLFLRGELDEALRIRTQEELPVFERLGDIYSRALTLGKIADIFQARGEFDEALRIRTQEELPVYERLGDVRSRAITLGRVADILQARGEFDEAIRIQQEEIPVFDRLGDIRGLLFGRFQLAITLAERGRREDIPKAISLLASSLAEARRLRLHEVPQIEAVIRKLGGDPDCPPFSSQP